MPSLRIISGELGGRVIKTPIKKILKPTPSRVREQLFSWIRPDLADTQCLDLFAGSGSLGIEAISNGADNCIFVEQNQELNFYLKNNCDDLGITDKTEILRQSAENFIRRVKDKKFDIIFFDPPATTSSSFRNTFHPTVACFPSKTIPVAFSETRFS